MDAKTGEIKLTGFKGDKHSPERDSLQVRVVAEKIDTDPETGKPELKRFASKPIPVTLLGDDGAPITGRSITHSFLFDMFNILSDFLTY